METGPEPGPDPDTLMDPAHEPVTGPVPVTDPAADPDVEPLHRGGFRCRLCQITAANLPSLQSHLAGKRHRRLRWLRAERRAQEQRSLFVSGFPRGTEPARLRQHFRAFGDVATVVMDKEKGAFAIVELRDPAGRQRALEQPQHLLGGRRLRVRPREHRDFPRPPPRDPPGTPPVPPGLLQALGQAQDVEAQLELLVRALELSAAERRLRELLLSLIREVFTEFFPGCSVVPYGSSVNGFDVHGCDLDLHLELGGGDGDPGGQETPNGDPQTQETPNGDPQSQRTPNGDPQTQETPNRDPQTQRTPNKDPQTPGTLRGDGDPPPNGSLWGDKDPPLQGSLLGDRVSLLGSDRSYLGSVLGDREEPPITGSCLGDKGSILGSEESREGSLLGDRGSLLGSEGSVLGDKGPLLGDKGSLLGDRRSLLGDKGSLLGDRGSLLGDKGSLLGDRGSLLESEGSHLGSEGSLLGSEGSILGDKGSLLGDRRSLLGDRGSLLGDRGSLLGDRGSLLESEGSHLGSEGSHLGSEGSLLGDTTPSLEGSILGDDPSPSPPSSEGSLSGDDPPEAEGSLLGRGAPPEQVLALVGAVLRRCVPGVRAVRAVASARRPVVKFSHKQSGLAGDVCLDNRLALFNTRFLRLCADLDPRVRPLGYAVRLWAGRQRLAGNRAGGGPLLTNYALTLLVVLFLQSRSPPVLPSLRHLRRLAGPQERAQVGGWDCSFPREAAGLERSGNGQSAASLLAEFFSYFGTLDLGGLLLSPLEGRALPRPPPETLGGLRPGPLTLQDPFELSHNVAANVTAHTVSRFARCCRDAARLCRGPEFLQKSRRGRPWGVMRLLRPGTTPECGNSRGKSLIPIPLPSPGGAARVCEAVGFVLSEVLGCGCHPRGGFGDTGTPGESPPGAECHMEGVAGDSRGEFGDMGTPGESAPGAGGEFGDLGTLGEPPPGAKCHLEKVAGDSGGEFGDMGTSGEPPPGAECHLEKVAGGSRGEFGDLGTSGVSPPVAGCHLEEVTGDARGGFGDTVTPGPGWKRRLPEGIPNGSGVPPSKRPRLPPVPARWSCCVRYRVWRGRRRLRRLLQRGDTGDNRGGLEGGPEGPQGAGDPRGVRDFGGPGGSQGPGNLGGPSGSGGSPGPGGSPLSLERAVTEAIVRGDIGDPPGDPPEPLLRFQLSAQRGGSRRDPQILLRLEPEAAPPSPLFQEFFHFLRGFLPGMVRQRLACGDRGHSQ